MAAFVIFGVANMKTPQVVPYSYGVVAVKTPLLERKYIIRYGKLTKGKNTYERKKLLFNI